MHPIDSDKVLAELAYPMFRSFERARWDCVRRHNTQQETPMKTILLALALAFAVASPSMAVEFNNYTVGAFSR